MKIHVGPVAYELEVCPPASSTLQPFIERDDLGRICYQKQLIWIKQGLGLDRKACTICHEVVHALVNACSIRFNMPKEDAVDLLAHALVQLIRDNPELVAMIQAKATAELSVTGTPYRRGDLLTILDDPEPETCR